MQTTPELSKLSNKLVSMSDSSSLMRSRVMVAGSKLTLWTAGMRPGCKPAISNGSWTEDGRLGFDLADEILFINVIITDDFDFMVFDLVV